MAGDKITKTELDSLPEILKQLYADQVLSRANMNAKMMMIERETQSKFKEEETKIDQRMKKTDNDDKLYDACQRYIKEVIEMTDPMTFRGDEARSKYHKEVSELSGLSELHIAKASSALGSVIGLPIAQLLGGQFTLQEKKVIIIDYGHKFFKWIKTQMRLVKDGKIKDEYA